MAVVDVALLIITGNTVVVDSNTESQPRSQPYEVYGDLTMGLTAENLAWHVVFGLGSRHVVAVMVDGVWRVWARRPLSVNPSVVAEQAREAASAVWARMSEK